MNFGHILKPVCAIFLHKSKQSSQQNVKIVYSLQVILFPMYFNFCSAFPITVLKIFHVVCVEIWAMFVNLTKYLNNGCKYNFYFKWARTVKYSIIISRNFCSKFCCNPFTNVWSSDQLNWVSAYVLAELKAIEREPKCTYKFITAPSTNRWWITSDLKTRRAEVVG